MIWALEHGGAWPTELAYIALADRMGCTWKELLDTPLSVVEDYRIVMAAEATVVANARR